MLDEEYRMLQAKIADALDEYKDSVDAKLASSKILTKAEKAFLVGWIQLLEQDNPGNRVVALKRYDTRVMAKFKNFITIGNQWSFTYISNTLRGMRNNEEYSLEELGVDE